MTFRPLLRLAARAVLLALVTASVSVGCSRQGEGERCDLTAAGNDDCDSGLVCTSCGKLADHVTDRCCPVNGGSDPRCRLSSSEGQCLTQVGSGNSAGAAGAGGSAAGSAGTAGAGGAAAGTAGTAGAGGAAAGTAGASSGGTAGEDEQPAGAAGA